MSVQYRGQAGLVESYPIVARNVPPFEVDRNGQRVFGKISPDKCMKSRTFSSVKRRIFSSISAKCEADMYQPMSIALTQMSIETSSEHDKMVVVFVPTSSKRLLVEEGLSPKTDLVAFFAPRDVARRITDGERISAHTLPTPHKIVAIVEMSPVMDPSTLCLQNLSIIAQHRPASRFHYGLVITRRFFKFYYIGLRFTRRPIEVEWSSKICIEQLYTCVKVIRKQAIRSCKRQTTRTMTPGIAYVMKQGMTLLATYSASANGKRYDLFLVFAGRDPSRRPFIALATCGDQLKDARILKYSWYPENKPQMEYQILTKIQDAPGVIQIDDKLSCNRVEYDLRSGYARSLIAMKIAGYPLCSCRSVKEFLEAMYDLLEVLRYLAHEKKILHRDINWRSVLLVRPQDASDIKDYVTSKETDEEIKHRYRFISNIYCEEKTRVRIALCDFEQAADLRTGRADDLSNAESTMMFIAGDIFRSQYYHHWCEPATVLSPKFWRTEQSKYYDVVEKASWDEFYSQMEHSDFGLAEDSQHHGIHRNALEHTAAHDAESVFFLCILFFCRMARKRCTAENSPSIAGMSRIVSHLINKHLDGHRRHWIRGLLLSLEVGSCDPQFLFMLRCMANYLDLPWSALSSTGRGGRYEFHVHDYFQRLFLKELTRMREQGDDIPIEELPYTVRNIDREINYVYRGLSCDMPDLLRKWESKVYEGEPFTVLGKRKREGDEDISSLHESFAESSAVDKAGDCGSGRLRCCPEEFKDLLKFKKQENYWLATS